MSQAIIGDLAEGRIAFDEASAALRGQLDAGVITISEIADLVRTEARRYGLDDQRADALLASLQQETRLRVAATRIHAQTTARETAPAPTTVRGAAAIVCADVSPELQPGSVLKGRFELETLVGRGGMGTVFSAFDRRKVEAGDPHPQVAVKVLNEGFQRHPDAFVALQREASKVQTLAHPNIVTVFDFDRDGPNVFITMELLHGKSLEQWIHEVRMGGAGRATALPIIRGIAEGLGYAHRKGIVHSDLKPANIFVVDDGTPKILDFGIARAVPSAAGAGARDRFDAGALGACTEAYATDEMVQGAAPSPADDIYALGVIVYEMLTGKHPFAGKSLGQARAAGMTAPPIKVLNRRERHTLARALAFDRAARPRDAAEFLRQFFGATRLRNAAVGVILVLAVAAGYLWIQNYRQAGPAVPFEQLPLATQQQIKTDFAEGDKAWGFYEHQGIADALEGSLSYYADAYRLHKGDRQAVRGLKRIANAMLERARSDPDTLRETARTLVETSEFFESYEPVANAVRQ